MLYVHGVVVEHKCGDVSTILVYPSFGSFVSVQLEVPRYAMVVLFGLSEGHKF